MKVFLNLLMASALAWASSSFACTLNDERNKITYQLNIPDDQCRAITYMDGRIIPVRLSYPQGQAVDYSWRGQKISLLIYYVDATYNIEASIDKSTYLRTENNIDIYRAPQEDILALSGKDGVRVFVRNRGHTWLARRMHRGILIIYQYQKDLMGLSDADDFVMQFVNKAITSEE
ncbi:MAG: hypothetical protein WCC29_05405 [Pseudomonas farsensis]|uniref:hypothetical protein n=1 Tax=Pseudomonas farsensis TaxID=2745492 RepID=UPI003C7B5AD9